MSAVISECGQYRYRLEREVQDHGKVVAFFGVNPSTADASLDDATVRKWRGFSARNGFARFIVGNAFAYRSTDPKALASVFDAVGPDNDHHIKQIISAADVLVPCWGAWGKVPKEMRGRFGNLMQLLIASRKPVMAFGITACGQPKHPLMLGYETPILPIIDWLD